MTDQIFEKAHAAEIKGDYLTAADMYHKAGKAEDANRVMGMHYVEQKDYSKAIQCFSKTESYENLAEAYSKIGDESNYHKNLAKHYLKKSQLKESAYQFELAGEYAKAAKIYETIFDYKNAIRFYVRANQIQTAGDLLIRIGERKKAARLFEKAKKYDLAIKHYKDTESYRELIELYERIQNYYEAFKIAFKIKDIPMSMEFAAKIAKTDPNYVQAHIYLMSHALDLKNFDEVLSIFENHLQDSTIKFNEKSRTSCAEILESSGHVKQALDVYYMLMNNVSDDANIKNKIKNLERKFQQAYTLPALKTYQDRFQLYKKMGTGAMGSVYKAKDLVTNQWVALKTLPTRHQDEELLRAFIQEGRTSKRLDHPNITKIYDYGIENDHYFISMEFLEGKTLKEVLQQIGYLNVTNFLSIALPLSQALAYAHQNHTIHRDIKPGNIMLLANRAVKLMDFGISKITQFSDHKSIARGTPIYISPEQILGIQTTKQSDLYSLGVVFYEMLSGKPPFVEGDILHDHIHKPAEELGKIVSNLPYRLVNLIMSCLAKKPDRRPMSAQKIIEVLEVIAKEYTEETDPQREL